MTNYNEWHGRNQLDNHVDSPWYEFVNRCLQPEMMDDKVVLEIGCGRGGFSISLTQKFPSVLKLFACDYSETALSIGEASTTKSGRLTWQKEDIQALSFPDDHFHTVISCETIEHVPRPMKALEEIYRVLKPGGRFILTCPNYFNLFGIWCLYRKMIGKPFTEGGQPYVNYLLLPSIYRKLKALGFQVEHFHTSEFIIPWRVPKTFFKERTPSAIEFLGSRTFYLMTKK
jgi:SAM-dependent methyltransferase